MAYGAAILVEGDDMRRPNSILPQAMRPCPSRTTSPLDLRLGLSGDKTADGRRKRRKMKPLGTSTLLCALLASSLPTATAQSCIALSGSSACPSFNASSISTDSALVGLFPFLSSVTDRASFDSGLQSYISGDFAKMKYQQLLGCSDVNTANTTDLYARYTSSVLCNSIVQNSLKPCGLSGNGARPLCADSCASYAQSEQEIAASNICGNQGSDAVNQIRADFTNCALPADSLSGSCIEAAQNEPSNCGFSTNIGALCSYCAASSPNSTDSCCVFSGSESRCKGVTLPIFASSVLWDVVTLTMTTTPTGTSVAATSSAAAAASKSHHGLTGGAIAGIVIGAIVASLLLLGLILLGCMMLRRRRERRPKSSLFNQPVTSRHQPPMAFHDGAREEEHAGLPGARVARMSALEGGDGFSRDRSGYSPVGAYGSPLDDEFPHEPQVLGLSPLPKRAASLTSTSHLSAAGGRLDTSPSTNDEDFTSPDSQQSERLAFFKDYYSQDEIHPGDLVSTLWAYEPRAADEFHLERGDMIKVLGIWDDGWATGVRARQKAEEWRQSGKSQSQRDSGLSQGSPATSPGSSGGDVKAFPLVCVCLPQHWRKTIEGDSTEGSGQHPAFR